MREGSSDLKILVVDDQRPVLDISVRILEALGYSGVASASDGETALRMLAPDRQAVDVIICDLHMPGLDGIQLLRRIAEAGFDGGVILLSGEGERILEGVRDLARAFQLNVLGAISKPLDPSLLRQLLEGFKPRHVTDTHFRETPIEAAELAAGIRDGAVLVVFQPKIRTGTGKIDGVEALARWRHPQRGILGPGTFIPLAEETGLIDELSDAMYSAAVAEARRWSDEGLRCEMSVNFPVDSFTRPGFAERLLETVQREGVDPASITLEVTESQVMSDALNSIETMMRLRLRKFGLSIDDFGTGHSSLYKLKQVPFTELKIDRAFVCGAAADAAARAILESSVDLARKLGMQVVAEGVETREDWDLVERLGCDLVQGYYCARPMSGNEMLEFAAAWTGPH